MNYINAPIKYITQLSDVSPTLTSDNFLYSKYNATLGLVEVKSINPSSTSIILVTGTEQLVRAALSGDVTAAQNSNVTTIANNAVTNAKAADMSANTIKGNNTGSTSDPKDLTIAQVNGMLGINPEDFTFTNITRANLLTAISGSTLEVGRYYFISDRNMIVRAVENNKVVSYFYKHTKIIPSDYYSDGVVSSLYRGVLSFNKTISSSQMFIWGGTMYRATGTITVGMTLPTDYITIDTFANYVIDNTFNYNTVYLKCQYDVVTDHIGYMEDWKGNKVKGWQGDTFSNQQYIIFSDFGNEKIANNECTGALINNHIGTKMENNICAGEISNNSIGTNLYLNILGSYYSKRTLSHNYSTGVIFNNVGLCILYNGNILNGPITIDNNSVDIIMNNNKANISNNIGKKINDNSTYNNIAHNTCTYISNNTGNSQITYNTVKLITNNSTPTISYNQGYSITYNTTSSQINNNNVNTINGNGGININYNIMYIIDSNYINYIEENNGVSIIGNTEKYYITQNNVSYITSNKGTGGSRYITQNNGLIITGNNGQNINFNNVTEISNNNCSYLIGYNTGYKISGNTLTSHNNYNTIAFNFCNEISNNTGSSYITNNKAYNITGCSGSGYIANNVLNGSITSVTMAGYNISKHNRINDIPTQTLSASINGPFAKTMSYSIANNDNQTLTHNMGYIPMIMIQVNTGGAGYIKITSVTTTQVTLNNTGGSSATGTIYIY